MRLVTYFCYWLSVFIPLNIFAQFSLPHHIDNPGQLTVLRAADLDGDNDLDFLAGSGYSPSCNCNLGNGLFWYENIDGSGLNFEKHSIYIPSPRCTTAELGDFDQDGDLDIAAIVAASGGPALGGGTVLIKNMDGQGESWSSNYVSSQNIGTLIVGDWDTDGDQDIVAQYTSELYFLENIDGQGSIYPPNMISDVIYGWQNTLAFIDSDLDNDLDLICGTDKYGSYPPNRIWHFKNQDGSGDEVLASIIDTHNNIPFNIQVVDLNQDGFPDYVYDDGRSIAVHYNNNGAFTQNTRQLIHNFLPYPGGVDKNALNIQVADFNLDGEIDIAFGDPQTKKLNIIYHANGFFSDPYILFTLPTPIQDLLVDDFDGDGDPDIVYSNEDGELHIIFNQAQPNPMDSKISGSVYRDVNENGVFDSTDHALAISPLSIDPNSLLTWTNASGSYFFNSSPNQAYTISCDDLPNWAFTTPSSFSDITPDTSAIIHYDFGLNPTVEVRDAHLCMCSGMNRCHWETYLNVNIYNAGTSPLSGVLQVDIDPLIQITGYTFDPDSISGNSLFWYLEDLLPFQYDYQKIYVQLPDETATGEIMNYDAQLHLSAQDGPPIYREKSLERLLLCSYDPNDKLQENTGPSATWVWLQDTLEYTVRFQNTGNDTAFNVRIEDVLSPYLDASTFQPLATSHPAQIILQEDGYLSYLFEDIQLPDSASNMVESQGFLQFRIQPKSGIPDSSIIENTAAIFFDANSPIITNTTSIYAVDKMPFQYNLQAPGCESSHNGHITMDIDVDSSYFSYYWNINANGPSAYNLPAGIYQLQIRTPDEELVLAKQWQLPENPVLHLDIAQTPAINDLDNGTITVSPSGGSLPYVFDWGISLPPLTNERENLSPGWYPFTVTDVYNDCTIGDSVFVEHKIFTSELTITQPSCHNELDGSISVSITPDDGTPFIYHWNDDLTGTMIDSLNGGQYIFSLLYQADGIVLQDTIDLDNPPAIVVAQDVEPSLPGEATGSASLIPLSGALPFSYLWSTTPVQTEATATNLAAGTYEVLLTDANGCTKWVEVKISSELNGVESPAAPWHFTTAPNPAIEKVFCTLQLDHATSWQALLHNAQGQLLQQWSNDQFPGLNAQWSIQNLRPGIYFLTITIDGFSRTEKIIVQA